MKKYWKAIFIAVFSIIVFSIYYVNVSSYSDTLPQFALQTIEGDEQLVEDVVVGGDLNLSTLNLESFKIEEKGTAYFRDESFLNRLVGHYYPEYIDTLLQEHKSFMRGKEKYPEHFYESEELLVYASVGTNAFFGQSNRDLIVGVLDKKTDEQKTFHVPIKDVDNFWSVNVIGTQIMDDTLYVLTNNMEENETGHTKNTIRNYAVNLSSGKVISVDSIYSVEDSIGDNSYVGVEVILNEDPHQPIYSVVKYETIYGEYDDHGNMVEDDQTNLLSVQFYDLTTNKEVNLNIPNDIGFPFAFQNDTLLLADTEPNNLHLTSYDIAKETTLGELEVEMENMNLSYMELIYEKTIEDGKLYLQTMTEKLEKLPKIAVIDISEMETDYLGEIVLENEEEALEMAENGLMEEQYQVYFSGIELKRD